MASTSSVGIGGHDDGQLLGRRHHAAHGMDRELLDNAIDRSGQELKLRSLAPPLPNRRQASGFALRLREFAE